MGAKERPDLPVTCPFFVAILLDQYGEHSCKVHPGAAKEESAQTGYLHCVA